MQVKTLTAACAYFLQGMLSAGFRPFFLLSALWAAIAIPVWLAAYAHGYAPRTGLPAMLWHGHEMVYGFGAVTVAGFMLTAIPNWTGRLPVRNAPLAALAGLWLAGRIAMLGAADLGVLATVADLAFPVAFLAVVARELVAGRNWRNLPMLGALSLLLAGNVLVHLHLLDIAYLAALGNRLGIATLLLLIALVGGRIVPSFTRNWMVRHKPGRALPAQFGLVDRIALALSVAALLSWAFLPDAPASSLLELAAGVALAVRLGRWRGTATVSEPLLLILHLGYGWLAFGLALSGLNGLWPFVPPAAALHALTVGAIGTMTLAVMTRASLGHSGRPLVADGATVAIYALISAAALLRLASAFAGAHSLLVTSLAGVAWSAAFGTFALHYGPLLARRNIPSPAG